MVKHTRDCVECGGVLNNTRSRPLNVCSKCKHVAWRRRAEARGIDVDELLRNKRRKEKKVYYDVRGGKRHMTREEYDALLEKQGGVCAICREAERIIDARGGVKRLCVDHDHVTGRIRGLLCGRCNKGLGCLGDSVAGLERVLAYLNQVEVAPFVAGTG